MDNNILSVFRNGNEILLTENEGLDGSTLIPVIWIFYLFTIFVGNCMTWQQQLKIL